jgi:ATP-dependent Zn protease
MASRYNWGIVNNATQTGNEKMTTATRSHKEVTAHIRKRLKAAGIKAKCKMVSYCGRDTVQVAVPTFESRFTSEQIREFVTAAKVNGMTGCRGMELDIEHEAGLTGKIQWNFYL